MELYPVFLNLAGKKCLVVGGGEVAQRKVAALMSTGAVITLVSPVLIPSLADLAQQGKVFYRQGSYDAADLDGIFLAISATNDAVINGTIFNDCRRRNIMVNVVDDPSGCDFHVPAVIRRGAFQMAISTGGKSPRLARLIRRELEQEYGSQFKDFVDFMGQIRMQISNTVEDPKQRNIILKNLVDGQTVVLLKQGNLEQAKERVNNVYNRHRC